jgi:membrane complex biogenesis BtpA family protein
MLTTVAGPRPNRLVELFSQVKPLIGTIHSLPLPGAPRYRGEPVEAIYDYAVQEALSYKEGGIDGLIVENSGDLPFAKPDKLGPETAAVMAVMCYLVREATGLPTGVNCLATAAVQSLAIAKAGGGTFIRVNQWVNAYVANEGFIEGQSADAMRYRSLIGAQEVAIFADVHVKHGSHAVVEDRPLPEQARDAEFFDADVLIATGNRTGDATPVEEIKGIRTGAALPVIIGSGLTADNAYELMSHADGAIVGSSLKADGNWWNRVELERVKRLMEVVSRLR